MLLAVRSRVTVRPEDRAALAAFAAPRVSDAAEQVAPEHVRVFAEPDGAHGDGVKHNPKGMR